MVYSHAIPKEAEIANFPIIANVITNQFVSVRARHVLQCGYLMENLLGRNEVLTVEDLVPMALGILSSVKFCVKNHEGGDIVGNLSQDSNILRNIIFKKFSPAGEYRFK